MEKEFVIWCMLITCGTILFSACVDKEPTSGVSEQENKIPNIRIESPMGYGSFSVCDEDDIDWHNCTIEINSEYKCKDKIDLSKGCINREAYNCENGIGTMMPMSERFYSFKISCKEGEITKTA